jgi:hypothetical protein
MMYFFIAIPTCSGVNDLTPASNCSSHWCVYRLVVVFSLFEQARRFHLALLAAHVRFPVGDGQS